MTKDDYQNNLAFLDRVETKGLAEAALLTDLARKLQAEMEAFGKAALVAPAAPIEEGIKP